MALFVDENLGSDFVFALRSAGLEVVWAVPDFAGWSDASIAGLASQNAYTIVTSDRGFPERLIASRDKKSASFCFGCFDFPTQNVHASQSKKSCGFRGGLLA